jgi:Uma2 family endonuclease
MGTPAAAKVTYDELVAMPGSEFRELIDGVVYMTPGALPQHGVAVVRLITALTNWADEHGGQVWTDPTDVYIDQHNVLQPDVLFVAAEDLERVERARITHPPSVVFEVSSPSTRRRDLGVKRGLYAGMGVPEYVFVDLDQRRVLVQRLAAGAYDQVGVLAAGDVLTLAAAPGFTLPVARLFAPPGAR